MAERSTDIAIVGAGPSALAFLAGLRPRPGRRILVMAPPAPSGPMSSSSGDRVPRSPKLRQPQVAREVQNWLSTLPLRRSQSSESFSAVGVHGPGGGARFWGATLSVFPDQALSDNGLDAEEIRSAYPAVGQLLPVLGNVADLLVRDFHPLPPSPPLMRSRRLRRLDGSYCGGTLAVGSARVAIRGSGPSGCIGCNKCLSGCPLGSVWAPGEADFRALGHEISFLPGLVETIEPEADGRATLRCGGGLSVRADRVVLATGPIPGFVLLARIAGTQPVEAPLVHSPTFGFALWGGTEPERSMFGMAQAALISRNTEGVAESIGSLYDGRSLVGHGARVFFDDLPRDWAAQIAARFLVFGALYLDSSWSRCRMSMTGGELSITADKAPGYPERALRLRKLVKSFSREAGMPLLSFQEGGLGVDVHYGDGVPPAMRTPDTARRGSLSGLPQVTLVGGACFSALPPHYPTLTFMAQSFAVGQALSEHV